MKYTKAMIETIDLTAEDVVLTSGCPAETGCPTQCATDCPANKCATEIII